MKQLLLAASALVSATLLANYGAGAATYIPVVPPDGAVSTTVFGINDSNIVAGSYNDSAGVEHGFFGPLDGSNYTVVDFGGSATGTELRGIGNDGSITGIAKGSGFSFGEEFFRSPDGTMTPIGNKNIPLFDGVAQGINDKDFFVGDFVGEKGARVGYQGKDMAYKQRFKLHFDGITATNPRERNNVGQITGSYTDSSSVQHAILIKNNGSEAPEVIDYPDAVGVTVGEGLNDSGEISGLWTDSSGNRHGFVLDTTTDTFTLIDGGDGSIFQQVWGINSAGLVAVNTTTDGTTFNSYIYCPLKASDCPQGGREVKVRKIHVSADTFHAYDKFGRTGRRALPARSIKKMANVS